jgi:hypothetical protein
VIVQGAVPAFAEVDESFTGRFLRAVLPAKAAAAA